MTDYRVICSKASDNWNRNPINRFAKPMAQKLAAKWDKVCPGTHHVEERS